jgi:hypothetical protein
MRPGSLRKKIIPRPSKIVACPGPPGPTGPRVWASTVGSRSSRDRRATRVLVNRSAMRPSPRLPTPAVFRCAWAMPASVPSTTESAARPGTTPVLPKAASRAGADPANPVRITHLGHLNYWRNAVAHQKATPPPPGVPAVLLLADIQTWRASCDGLATSLDHIMHAELLRILGVAPW